MDAETIVKLALKTGFNEAVAVVRVSKWRMLRIANNEASVFNYWIDEWASVYLTKDRRIYTFHTSNLSEDAIKVKLNEALSVISRLNEDPEYVPVTHQGSVSTWDSYDSSIEDAEEKVIDMVKEAIDASLSEGSVRNAGAFTYGVSESMYSDHTGLNLNWKGTFFNLAIRAFHNDPELSSMDALTGRRLSDIDAKGLGSRVGFMLSLASKLPKTSVEGRFRVIMSPLVAGHLYSIISNSWMNAYNVLRNLSPLGVKDIGNKVASEPLTLIDLSADPSRVGSEPVDFEGNQTSNVTLVKNGVLSSFITNNRTASKLSGKSTGNAAHGWLTPSIRHLHIGPGSLKDDPQSMFNELGNGVFVQNNWYTRFQNIREGIFSTVCRDVVLLIENGEPKYVLKGVRISDRFNTLLNNYMDSTGKPTQVFWWDMHVPSTVPYILVDKVNITKSFESR
ncbi:TldD/PmbA family protein [Caldivirga maquilingensis]|uniref:Peptidase U62 modulator of DNA gyrase n=1 Tax=Caldivirga maquilingensis (strain ATCC 700844 / DSM 13496 / JCM 10307 / IC-167) TaxID=397948 RepID=A8M9G1_CALMQ|nr:TldD/PmbA family protein [Caldivirga maquilingensis]ABW02380.1 peptidase U62 modulator of DNA gyrase [Caldivirga maquilingensis IC-167]